MVVTMVVAMVVTMKVTMVVAMLCGAAAPLIGTMMLVLLIDAGAAGAAGAACADELFTVSFLCFPLVSSATRRRRPHQGTSPRRPRYATALRTAACTRRALSPYLASRVRRVASCRWNPLMASTGLKPHHSHEIVPGTHPRSAR